LAEEAIEVAHASANRWTGSTFYVFMLILPPYGVVSRRGEWNIWYYEISHFDTSMMVLIIIFLLWLKNGADNIFTLKQWCSNNFPQAKEQLQNMY
jgi:hypothetical protein